MQLVTPVTQKTRLVNLVTQRMRTAPVDQLTFLVRIGILSFYFIGGLMMRCDVIWNSVVSHFILLSLAMHLEWESGKLVDLV